MELITKVDEKTGKEVTRYHCASPLHRGAKIDFGTGRTDVRVILPKGKQSLSDP